MAWEGIKSAIPPALIQILIEKVISMIVPAAGAVLAIIEGLQAAWGTVSRVIQAFDRFMGFLKAVKTGQSGPQFGAALAAAGVVLIDFVSNWLLKRVRGAASKVAAKIKEIAKKIGNKIKGKLGKFKDNFFGNKGKKGPKDAKHPDDKKSKDKDNKEKDDIAKKQEKVDKAVEVAAAAVNRYSGQPVAKMLLTPMLYAIKLRYGLKVLKPLKQGEYWAVYGEINPKANKTTGALYRGDDYLTSSTNAKGMKKPHISQSGNLVPANIAGVQSSGKYKGQDVFHTEHILGGYRKKAKSNSSFTSFTPSEEIAEGYGKTLLKLDLPRLRKAIQSGRVQGVAILSPKIIRKLFERDSRNTVHWKNMAQKWSNRDGEYLIKGEIPKEFFRKTRRKKKK
jgi:hypothetical protein